MKHNEVHQSLLEVWFGTNGLMAHRYRRCAHSGAGNCCCGRAEESRLHTPENAAHEVSRGNNLMTQHT